MSLTDIRCMPFGKVRRDAIIDWLNTHTGLPVNCKYQFLTRYDKDLQRMLKKKILKQVRLSKGGGANQTYLVLADK